MRNSVFVLFIIMLISMASCRSDFDFETSTGGLQFSKDTVYLDTVFTNIGSSTYTLKVYNRSDKNIAIPTVQLGKGLNSKYRMTVDGMRGDGNSGKIFTNVELLAKDSLYIFIETTAAITDANPTDFLYTDQIQFGSGTNMQKVELVTLIQDAYFIYPRREDGIYEGVPIGINEDNSVALVQGRNLNHDHPDNGDEYTFKTDKPYVIYGFASVPDTEVLTIPSKARVHFHADSGLIIQEGGTLNITGLASPEDSNENEVVFEGDRLEPDYSDVPGQWGFVYLRQGSSANINHLTLKNAIVGLLIENNAGTIQINNSQIYDCSNVGILARAANIEGTNVVVNSAGQAALACTYGGSYLFTHCTFNNNWPSSGQAAVLLSNYISNGNDIIPNALTQATFNNSIIYGSNLVELILDKNDDDTPFNFLFNNCLVKFNDAGTSLASNPLYDSIRNEENGNIKNESPDFLDINANKLNISLESPAVDKANPAFFVPFDVNGNSRTTLDIGAYQSAAFPE